MARLLCCTALVLAALSAVAADVAVSFIDAPERNYLHGSGSVDTAAEVKDLAAVVTSLLNVPAVSKIDAEISDQVRAPALVVKGTVSERSNMWDTLRRTVESYQCLNSTALALPIAPDMAGETVPVPGISFPDCQA